MTDIVERLRAMRGGVERTWPNMDGVLAEAVEEIERLRKEAHVTETALEYANEELDRIVGVE